MGAMSADPEAALPIRLNVDDSDSPSDVVDALFLGRFATGEQPYSHSSSIDRVKKGLTLLPHDATVLRVGHTFEQAVGGFPTPAAAIAGTRSTRVFVSRRPRRRGNGRPPCGLRGDCRMWW